ncbi:multidrug effflux MFS transporter [Nocardioides sp. cx-169]|uniref:multidrug effflux MFS transporter n=1 Tax=Nocardioides sp. cx-169 TaxID=2899080 RepID=UPI001E4D2D3F|nr:multidrug effflux MFS transporter [Nocardioides sp. cx-169]MCD4534334.1 multidrug effflux MFS transporter [Nocardioides sp. cx-169]
MKTEEPLGRRLLVVLALLSATAPVSIDLYLASFPAVRDSLRTEASSVQLTLTAFLAGLAIGQIFWGPIADRFGRLRPLLVGCAVSTVAAAAAVFAPTIEVLIAARFFQALAGAAGVVICRAIVADRLQGFAAARAMSLLASLTSIAPVLAPLFGGALAGHLSWRAILGLVLVLTVLQLVGVVTAVRESLPAERRTRRLSYGHLGALLRRPVYLGYASAAAFTFGMLMSFISTSSFVYQGVIGTSELVYGIGFAVNALGMMAGSLISVRLAGRRVPPANTVRAALAVATVGCATFLAVAALPLPAWLLLVPLFVVISSVGFVMGNSGALVMEQSRDYAGSGSAVMGAMMFLFGGLVSPIGGLWGDQTAVPVAVVMLVCGSAAFICIHLTHRARRSAVAVPVP